MNLDHDILNRVVDAWERLPPGYYKMTDPPLELWLRKEMQPAIDEARRHLKRLRPDGSTP